MAGGVALSSLRVTSDFDASGYARGAQQKVAADQSMINSDKARNASLAQADAALARIPAGMTAVSKALLDGYGAGAQFEAIVRRIGNSVDQGMGLDRANVLLDQAYKKFGLTADAAVLAQKGYVSIAQAVGELNERYGQLALAAESANAAVKASSTQAGINQSFGIGVDPAKSAQESADAFLAQYGGLEGIAKAKAAEIGAAFGADLEASLITGITKSARDSASVFEAQFKIIQQKAEQAGSNFQTSLNAQFGIGGPSAASQGATYSALTEQVQRLDQIEQARAAHLATSTQQSVAAAYGYDLISKSARESAAAFMDVDAAGAALAAEFDASIAAEAAMTAEAEKLRAVIDPLGTEFNRLGVQMAAYRKLLSEGAISTGEYEQAQVLLAKRLTDVQQQLNTTSSVGRVASGELVNLSYQLNDVVTGLALGQSPFMILAQQGGQVFQIFQSSKASISDFASVVTSKFLGLFTVGRVAFGGIASAIGLGTAALLSFESAQQDVQRSLLGAGRASGSSVGGIGEIAKSGSSPAGLSVSEARELASALAQTGKVANDNILPIVKMGKDISTVFGIDATEATKKLSDAFADPVKGADDLNARLGFLDAATRQNISNLTAQNQIYAAQVVLTNAVKGSLQDVAVTVSSSRTLWTALGNAVSNAYDGLGGFLARELGVQKSLDEQLHNAQQVLDSLKSQREDELKGGTNLGAALGFSSGSTSLSQITEAQKRVDDLTAAIQRQTTATREARDAQFSLAQQQAIRTALPVIGQTEQLQNQLKVLQDLAASPDVDQKLLKVGQSMDQLQRSIAATSSAIAAIPKTALVDFLGAAASPAERLAAGLEQIRVKAAQIGASSGDTSRANSALQLDIASSVQSARMSALGQSAGTLDTVKQKELELQRAQQAGAGLTKQQIKDQLDLARAQANGSLAIKAQTDSVNIQTATIGMSAGAAAEYTARMNLIAEALRNKKKLTDDDIASINAQAKALGQATQTNALRQVQNDINFNRQTALLSPEDVQIAQQLKQVYPDVAEGLKSVEAQGIRVNQALSGIASTVSGNLVTGISDAIDGTKTLGQSFTDTSKLIIRAIEEMIVKLLIVQPLMQSLQGGGSSLLNFLGLGTAPGLTSTGGIFGATGPTSVGGLPLVAPVARGGIFSGGNILPFAAGGVVSRSTYFPMANGGTGLMGEAGPEAVMPLRRGTDGKLGVAVGGGGSSSSSSVVSFGDIHINVPEGTSPTDAATIARTVRQTMEQVADERIMRANKSRGLNRAA